MQDVRATNNKYRTKTPSTISALPANKIVGFFNEQTENLVINSGRAIDTLERVNPVTLAKLRI